MPKPIDQVFGSYSAKTFRQSRFEGGAGTAGGASRIPGVTRNGVGSPPAAPTIRGPDGYTTSQVSSPHSHAIVLDATRKAVFTILAETPKEIVRYLEEKMKKAMEDPEHIKRAKDIGLELKRMSGEEYGRFLQEQDERVPPPIALYRK